MNAAPALHELERVYLYNMAVRKTVLQHAQGRQIGRIVERGHDEAAIAQIEIDVACSERPAAPVPPAALGLCNLDDFERASFGVARLGKIPLHFLTAAKSG